MTHIIRGADHLSNTPKQILQYQALGAPTPIFAHVPLILGPDKTRLSKRHGATSVISYREEGIVPEAFRNFLALLGWTPPDSSKEVMNDAELIAAFSLENIAHSNSVFDRAKLDWFNTEYIRAYPAEKLMPLIRDEWHRVNFTPENTDEKWLQSTVDLIKSRARGLKDFATTFKAYFTDDYETDPAAVEKFLKDESVRKMLGELSDRYAAANDFTEQSAEQVLRDFATEKGIKAGGLINGSRVALTGQAVAPSLFAVMVALGKEKTVKRLKAAAA
jgi:glutamyl-tRNA synthetase